MSEEIETNNNNNNNINVESTKDLTLEEEFETICTSLNNIKESINSLTILVRSFKKKLEKETGKKEKKEKEPKEPKEKKEKEPKQPKEPKEKKEKKPKEKKPVLTGNPSGLTKPVKISDKLANFISKPIGSEMTRSEVTAILYKYIQNHNLQDENNKRIIKPNTELKEFLNLPDNQELNYFNIQKMINIHFLHPDVNDIDDDIENNN
jgi:chromatin remodeling complex protein RSC6